MKNLIEKIRHKNKLLAIIIYSQYTTGQPEFLTDPELTPQIGLLKFAKGHEISKHYHNPIKRKIVGTSEIIIVREGKVMVQIYSEDKKLIANKLLQKSDIIFYFTGGHGFQILENTTLLEIKQGPYYGKNDKTHF